MKEYVEDLYGEEENTDSFVDISSNSVFDCIVNTGILKLEFEDILQTIKKNKAPSVDELNAEPPTTGKKWNKERSVWIVMSNIQYWDNSEGFQM